MVFQMYLAKLVAMAKLCIMKYATTKVSVLLPAGHVTSLTAALLPCELALRQA